MAGERQEPTRRLNPAGLFIIHGSLHGNCRARVMSFLFVGQVRTTSPYITTRKFDDAGTAYWTADHGTDVRAIVADSTGCIYTAAMTDWSGGYYAIRKYAADGTEITDGWPVTLADDPTSLAIDSSDAVYVGTLWTSDDSRSIQKYTSAG